MPWLRKLSDPCNQGDEPLLLVHIPRCGGTSLTEHFFVSKKAIESKRSCWGRMGMSYFFYRHRITQKTKYPIATWESAVALCLLMAGLSIALINGPASSSSSSSSSFGAAVAFVLIAASVPAFAIPAFFSTAPVVTRNDPIRKLYLRTVRTSLVRRCMESIEWLTGANEAGYLMHLTSRKLLARGYVTPEQMDEVGSLALVRNPYSRMVSLYRHNRYGPWESFEHFVQDWHRLSARYRDSGETEEWYTPCHCLPQYEYTHHRGKQIVQCVVRLEELKWMEHEEDYAEALERDITICHVPPLVRSALLGAPNVNKSKEMKGGMRWWDYYNQKTLDLTYGLYKVDFHVFGYAARIEERPDLMMPTAAIGENQKDIERMTRNSFMVDGRRVSKLKLLNSICAKRHSGLDSFADEPPADSINSATAERRTEETTSLLSSI